MNARIRKHSPVIPFGYEVDPEDPKRLLPIPEQLEILVRAREYYFGDRASIRSLIDWIHQHTGRKLSLEGFKQVMHRRW